MSAQTTRSIYKWGDPAVEQGLNDHYRHFLEESFGVKLTTGRHLPDAESLRLPKSRLKGPVLAALKKAVGADNVADSEYERATHSLGRFYREILLARLGKVEHPVDAVVYPRTQADVSAVLAICKKNKIAVIPCGARSSVTGALYAMRGGISLDLTRHLKRVIEINETNSSATVEAGILGPDLERQLNARGYTCGHFPQSFEFSTPGGWVSARGAGQASTGYGTMADLLLALTAVTTEGVLTTRDYPTASIGPDLKQLFLGAEGIFGVITQITMKIRKKDAHMGVPTSFVFKDFASAVTAMREIMQGQFGLPHFFRLQDAEETHIAFHAGGMAGGLADRFLQTLGYKPNERCLMHCLIEGDPDHAKLVLRKVRRAAKSHGAFETGKSPVYKWLEQRYSSAYLRDPLMDAGVMVDTLETAVTWEKLPGLHAAIRAAVKSRPNTLCLVHISHAYENGANLYAIFLGPMGSAAGKSNGQAELRDFESLHKKIVDAFHKHGGSLSHHHGIGRVMAPWAESELGRIGLGTLAALKKHFDPAGILNPGGVLGLK